MSDTQITALGEANSRLLERVREGDAQALETLVSQNMGLVRNISRRFMGRGAEYDDLVQIGAIGMIKAAKSFDPDFGTVFSTYAVPLIIGEIRRFLRDDGMIKVSRDIRKKGSIVMRAKENFLSEHGREPRMSELSEMCSLSCEEVVYSLDAVCPVYSLQESVGNDDENTTLESFTPSEENEIESVTDNMALSEAVKRLDERSRKIIYLRFYREMSQQQTAAALGITQVKVSREEKRIFSQLRRQL